MVLILRALVHTHTKGTQPALTSKPAADASHSLSRPVTCSKCPVKINQVNIKIKKKKEEEEAQCGSVSVVITKLLIYKYEKVKLSKMDQRKTAK